MRTAARSTTRARMARPSAALRSSVTLFLLPFSSRKNQASRSGRSDSARRPGSPPGGSILMTSAPSHASIWAQLGPASYCVRSSTTIPSSALAMWFPLQWGASTGPPCPPLLGDAPAQPGRPSISLRRPGASTGPQCPPLLGDAPAQRGRPSISLRRPGASTGPPCPPLLGDAPAQRGAAPRSRFVALGPRRAPHAPHYSETPRHSRGAPRSRFVALGPRRAPHAPHYSETPRHSRGPPLDLASSPWGLHGPPMPPITQRRPRTARA